MPVDNRWDFARLRFKGARYSKAQFPVEVLPELAAYRDLIMATARALYFRDHPQRKKVPRGFEASFNLVLSHVDEGSAVPVLSRVATTATALFPFLVGNYFDRARDLIEDSARCVAEGKEIPRELTARLSPKFGVFGRTLAPGETIYLSKPDEPQREDAPYNADVRKAIQLSLNDEYWEDLTLVGQVTAGDRRTGEFRVSDYITGVSAPFRPSVASEFKSMVDWFHDMPTVIAHGRALYRRGGTLAELEVDSVSLVEEDLAGEPNSEAVMPITDQLTSIAQLTAGWMDGRGEGYDPRTIERVRVVLEDLISQHGLPNPFVYPTPNNEVRVEWPSPEWDVVITFDRGADSVWLFATAIENDDEEDTRFSTRAQFDLTKLGAALQRLLKGQRA